MRAHTDTHVLENPNSVRLSLLCNVSPAVLYHIIRSSRSTILMYRIFAPVPALILGTTSPINEPSHWYVDPEQDCETKIFR
jgi:hypothetical protein